MRNLDITTLRSFVAVAEAGGVTRAAGFLHLTQSAVSMQLKRLEDMLGLDLLDRSGRGVSLTPAGAQLLTYAKKMVALNDDIFARLTLQEWEGEIVLGVPHDIVYPVMPLVLKRMGAEFPRVKVQLISSYTKILKEQFDRGEVDVILTTESAVGPEGETVAEESMRWVGAPNGVAFRQRPVRLGFVRDCAFRPRAVQALDDAAIAWDLAVDSQTDRTIEAVVSADLAVTTALYGHAPDHLAYVPTDAGLPDLGPQRINMYRSETRQSPIIDALADFIRSGFGGTGARKSAGAGAVAAG